jgi:DNA mismatch repair ATPase MutS
MEYLDECIQKLVASGKKVCLWDMFKGDEHVDEEKADEQAQAAQSKVEDSPLFKQFCDLKKKHPDALLLFRCGDSYKCYEEDAITAAAVLRLTDIVEEDKITIASFPYHALDTYLPRLIRAGHRIAICDQLEAPKPKKQAQMELFTNA